MDHTLSNKGESTGQWFIPRKFSGREGRGKRGAGLFSLLPPSCPSTVLPFFLFSFLFSFFLAFKVALRSGIHIEELRKASVRSIQSFNPSLFPLSFNKTGTEDTLWARHSTQRAGHRTKIPSCNQKHFSRKRGLCGSKAFGPTLTLPSFKYLRPIRK